MDWQRYWSCTIAVLRTRRKQLFGQQLLRLCHMYKMRGNGMASLNSHDFGIWIATLGEYGVEMGTGLKTYE